MSLASAALLPTHCSFFPRPSLIPPRRTHSSQSSSRSSAPFIALAAQDPPPSQVQQQQALGSSDGNGDGVDGPIELPPSDQDPFDFLNSTAPSSPLQSAISILFTGTLAVFLYRALRKRAKLVKETKFRSSGLQSLEGTKKEEVLLASVKKMGSKSPPSAVQTLQGAIIAGAIAYVLYNFSTYVDAGFASKPVSSVYTIRQLTITIRTIVTGLCYLATFVFAANSLGLGLYSIQIALNLSTTARPSSIENIATSDVDPMEPEAVEKANEEK